MKNCTHCTSAVWKTTANGSLHPSGTGQCKVVIKIPNLPACMYWLTKPSPQGGTINRRDELPEHCSYYLDKRNAK